MGRHRSSIVWTEREDWRRRCCKLDDDAFSDELAERFGRTTARCASPARAGPIRLALHHAESYVAPRLALIGDAAHVIHPIAGQGLNLGLRDVAALAEALVDAGRLGLDIGARRRARALSALAPLRQRRADRRDRRLNRLFSNDVPAVRLARDLGLGAVNRVPPLKRFFMRHAMGVGGRSAAVVAGGEPLGPLTLPALRAGPFPLPVGKGGERSEPGEGQRR